VGSVETGLNYGNVNKPVVHSTRTVNQYFTVQGRTVESCEKISAGITIKNGEKRVLNLRSKIGEK
jgi:hypothetical protein